MFEPLDYERGSVPWLFKSFSQSILLNLLQQVEGEKDVIISPELIQPLDLIVSFSKLKQCGVKKIYKIQDGPCEGSAESRIFLVNNEASTGRMIANKINSERSQRPNSRYWIFSVPKITKICELIYEEQGIYGYISCSDFPLCFVPLDSDLLSLEQDSLYNVFFLHKNFSVVSNISKALEQVDCVFGRPRKVTGIGKLSHMALKLNETLNKNSIKTLPSYDHLILIDRDVDYYSLLLSPLNYQGLLDEILGIRCSKIELPEEISQKIQIKKYTAQSSDPIFKHIRDSHLSVASANLKKIANELKDNSLKSKDMTIAQMKEFVQKELRNRKTLQVALRLHISLCEVIMEKKKESDFASQLVLERNIVEGADYRNCTTRIEEMIIRQICPIICLRMLCLLSICNDGIAAKDYVSLLKLYMQSFGHQHMLTLSNLKNLGLLVKQTSAMNFLSGPSNPVSNVIAQGRVASAISALPRRSHFRSIVKKFNLIPEVNSNTETTQSAQLYSNKCARSVFGDNYIPLIYRIVELAMSEANLSFSEQLGDVSKYIFQRDSPSTESSNPVIVVFFVGGVSYAEISALRHLATQRHRDIIILTTNIINGSRLLSKLLQ